MRNGEPRLDEILAEPIVQLLMVADRLEPEDVLAAVAQACRALGLGSDLYPDFRLRSRRERGGDLDVESNRGAERA